MIADPTSPWPSSTTRPLRTVTDDITEEAPLAVTA